MKKNLMMTLLATATLLAANGVWAKNVKTADKDNDGTLDKSEVKHKGIAKAFDQLDGDKDGTLDAKEIMAFFQKKN